MPFQPFRDAIVDRRVVLIPTHLDAESRERFIQKISAAARQQEQLAAKCDALLKIVGEPRIEDDRIVIAHEPARGISPVAIVSKDHPPDIDTLWWLTRSVLKALAAAAPGTPHGGITLASLFQDEMGRIKLGDFGIAPAYEAACGMEARRQVASDGETWALLGEEDTREFGWIAPYFAHEMLEGKQRLNPKSDQFAAGVALYLLGVGSHPYGAGLDDPTLMLYFHLEPFLVADERAGWAEVFERAEKDLSTAADKPILGWARLVQKLLASDPGERFAHAAEALQQAGEFCPAAWEQAERALTRGVELLEEGEADAALESASALKNDATLPELWRAPLGRWCADLAERKDEIGGYRRLKRRLAEGRAALNNVEVDRAREIAEAILAAPECDEELRAGARELIEYCREQQEFIQTGADELARAYLQSAKELIEAKSFDDARTILNGLLSDPATPKARANQTRQLSAEIELREQRLEQQQAELGGAEEDLRAGRLDAARQRLEALRAANELAPEVDERLAGLLEAVRAEQKRRAVYVAALDAARTAWERADLDALEANLAKAPADIPATELADVRRDLAARRDALQIVLDERAAIAELLEGNRPEDGLIRIERALQPELIPRILRDEIEALRERCQRKIDERERVRIEQVLGYLQAARAACEALKVDECRRRLEREILPQRGLPEGIAREAAGLEERCGRIEKVVQQFDYARTHMKDADFDGADALLNRMQLKGLPEELERRRDALRREIDKTRRDQRKFETERLAESLTRIEKAIGAGELSGAESELERIGTFGFLTDALRKRIAAAEKLLERLSPLVRLLDETRAALEADDSAADGLSERLRDFPTDPPAWLAERQAALRKRIEDTIARRRDERLARVAGLLDQAEAALKAGDLERGRASLADIDPAAELEGELDARHASARGMIADLEKWLPRIERAAGMVVRGEWLEAREELAALLGQDGIPAVCRERLDELQRRVEAHVEQWRSELDAELAALRRELTERGRKARRFEKRIDAVNADPLATDAHRAEAAELLEQWGRIETPKRSRTPYFVGAGVGIALIALIGLYLGGVFRPDVKEPLTPAKAVAAGGASEAAGSASKPAGLEEKRETPVVTPQSQSERVETPAQPIVATRDGPTSQQVVAAAVTEEPPTAVARESEPIDAGPAMQSEEPAATAPVETQTTEPAEETPILTVEQAAAEYLQELKKRLPEAARLGDLLPDSGGGYELDADLAAHDLLDYRELRFDETNGRFEPPAVDVAQYFALQIDALRAAEKPVEWEMPSSGSAAPAETVRLAVSITNDGGMTAVDLDARRVTLGGTARLEKDEREKAGFEFHATYADGGIRIDDASLPAYDEYLSALQMEHLGTLVKRFAEQYRLPEGVRVQVAAADGQRREVKLAIEGAGKQVWAEFKAIWNSSELRYEVDPGQATAAIRQGLQAAALSPTMRGTIEDGWRALRQRLATSLDENRREFLAGCEIQEIQPATGAAGEMWSVSLELAVGRPDDARRVRIPAKLTLRAGALVWDERGDQAVRTAVNEQLADLVQTLDDRLTRLAGQSAITPEEFRSVLLEVTKAKIERYQAARYVPATEFVQTPNAEAALVAMSAALQGLVAPDAGKNAFPTVFIEYYEGREQVFGLSWHAVTDKTDAILGVDRLKAWSVASTEEMRGYANPGTFRTAYAGDPTVGERLLGEALGAAIEGSGGGSFGVLIAPEGPLWLTRWEQVRFQPRPMHGVDLRGTPDPGGVTSLRELLRSARDGRGDYAWRRAGVWCVPTLTGRWNGPADQIDDFQLGALIPGKKPATARFKDWGKMTFAAITDPTLAGDFGWPKFAANVRPEEIGHVFWDRQWSGETWQPTPFASFALIQIP